METATNVFCCSLQLKKLWKAKSLLLFSVLKQCHSRPSIKIRQPKSFSYVYFTLLCSLSEFYSEPVSLFPEPFIEKFHFFFSLKKISPNISYGEKTNKHRPINFSPLFFLLISMKTILFWAIQHKSWSSIINFGLFTQRWPINTLVWQSIMSWHLCFLLCRPKFHYMQFVCVVYWSIELACIAHKIRLDYLLFN